MNDESIFVQIASYRDPELIPTVLDLLETAEQPDNIKICVCWQYDESENVSLIKQYNNIEIISVPYYESKGACWARNQIQRRYNGERYTLQLDSHHRFVNGWDTILKNMYQQCKLMGSAKPLITTYIPSFDPFKNKDTYEMIPWKMNFHKFLPEGAVFFIPEPIHDHEKFTAPIPARFYSAHFAFTDGIFCEEVSHDPEYYFYGEEISIAARAFTHGYDLYHPHKVVAWHEYTRSARIKHWDDHNFLNNQIKGITKNWWERDGTSQKRNRVLFGMEEDNNIMIPKKYGFGKERTLQEYEKYVGLNFKDKSYSIHALSGKIPPTPYTEDFLNDENPDPSNITTLVKKTTVGYKQIFDGEDIVSLKFKILNSNNKVVTVGSFDGNILSIFKNMNGQIPLNIKFDTMTPDDKFTCKFFAIDTFGSERLLCKIQL